MSHAIKYILEGPDISFQSCSLRCPDTSCARFRISCDWDRTLAAFAALARIADRVLAAEYPGSSIEWIRFRLWLWNDNSRVEKSRLAFMTRLALLSSWGRVELTYQGPWWTSGQHISSNFCVPLCHTLMAYATTIAMLALPEEMVRSACLERQQMLGRSLDHLEFK